MNNGKKGSIVFINYDDLLMKFAKDNDLSEYEILIISHEIVGSLKMKSTSYGISSNIEYESKYENIEFVSSLRPPVSAIEHISLNNKDTFLELYNNHLLSSEPYMDICSILDMAVNQGIQILMVSSAYEDALDIPYYLKEFIKDTFGFICYEFEDLERVKDAYEETDKHLKAKKMKSLPFDIPEEFYGNNFEVIVQNFGDEDAVREQLELEKIVAANMRAKAGHEDDLQSIFFNSITESLEEKVRENLLKRTDEQIKDMCRSSGIRIGSTYTSKETLVDKIIHSMKLNSARVVEYEQ